MRSGRRSLRRALVLLGLAWLVVFGQAFGFLPGAPGANAAGERQLTSTDIQLSVTSLTDANGKPYDPTNRASIDSPANITFDWAITSPQTIHSGDYYTFQLPDVFKMHNQVSGDLSAPDGTRYGTFTIDTGGNVMMTFNEQVAQHSNVHGTLEVHTQFNQETIHGSTTQEIRFPVTTSPDTVTVYFKPNVKDSIDKSGVPNRGMNPAAITWTVDVNKTLEKVNDAKVTEVLPAGLSLTTPDSVKVYHLNVNVDGSVIPGDEVTAGYTVDAAGTVTFTDPIDTAYRLVYQTAMDPGDVPTSGGTKPFTNTATFSGDNVQAVEAEATVDVGFGKMINKSKTDYDKATQTFAWKIDYNFGEKAIDQSEAYITDTFDASKLELLPDSLQVVPITFDAQGHPDAGTPLPSSQYTLSGDGSSGNPLKIQFNQNITGAYEVTYKTRVKPGVVIDQDTDFTNTATAGTGESTTGTGTAYQDNIFKLQPNDTVNYATKTVGWQIHVNGNRYMMKDWTLDDQFVSGGMSLVPNTLKILDTTTSGTTLTEGTDYTLTDNAGSGFGIRFTGSYANTDHTFTITYMTRYNTDSSLSDGTATTVKNRATATWSDTSGDSHTSTDTAEFDPNGQTQNNGFKSGSYNAVTKEITWRIGTNYNGDPADQPSVTDPIAGNQQFVPGSVKVWPYTVTTDGTITTGPTLETQQYRVTEPSSGNGNTLTVDFLTNDSTPYLIQFQTTLAGQVVQKQDTYTNVATYHNPGHPDRTLTAGVGIADGGSFIYKNGKQNGGNVDWTINVNPSQSTLEDVTVTDQPDTQQFLLGADTFKVYPAKLDERGPLRDADGNLIPDTSRPLTLGKDYTVEITTDNSKQPPTQRFVLKFIGDYQKIERAYVVQYASQIHISGSTGQVSNAVSVSGTNVQTYTQDWTKQVTVATSSGSGTGAGETGPLTVEKTGAGGNPLAGAEFELYRMIGGQTVLAGQGATDVQGHISFPNLPYGTYTLKETKAPPHYTISDQLVQGVAVNIDSTVGAAGAIYNAVDRQNKVTLRKEDPNGSPLPGAQFLLEQLGADGSYNPVATDDTITSDRVTSDANGWLEIDGLLPGQYRLMETQPPAGFRLNPTPIGFTVAMNTNNQVPDVNLGVFTNDRASSGGGGNGSGNQGGSGGGGNGSGNQGGSGDGGNGSGNQGGSGGGGNGSGNQGGSGGGGNGSGNQGGSGDGGSGSGSGPVTPGSGNGGAGENDGGSTSGGTSSQSPGAPGTGGSSTGGASGTTEVLPNTATNEPLYILAGLVMLILGSLLVRPVRKLWQSWR